MHLGDHPQGNVTQCVHDVVVSHDEMHSLSCALEWCAILHPCPESAPLSRTSATLSSRSPSATAHSAYEKHSNHQTLIPATMANPITKGVKKIQGMQNLNLQQCIQENSSL